MKSFNGILLSGGSICFFYMASLFNVGFSPLWWIGGVSIGLLLQFAEFTNDGSIAELFTNTKMLNVSGEMPRVLNKQKTLYGYDYTFSIPAGLALSNFEARKESIEQFTDTKVKFEFKDKSIIMHQFTKKVSDFYPFEVILTETMKLVIGNTYTGFKTIPLKSHVLICGASGFGKSTMERGIIVSLIVNNRPEDLILTMTDFKRNELGLFKDSSYVHRFCRTREELKKLLAELEKKAVQRYEMFDEKHVLDIDKYNSLYEPKMCKIVNIMDEIAQLDGDKEIMGMLQKRISYDRAAGIYYIICTQRPSVDLIPGSVKANIDTRICFKTSDSTNSWIVLDDKEAAQYLSVPGRGLLKYGGDMTEFQAMYISEEEAVNYVKHTFVEKPKKEAKHDNGKR